MKGYRKMRVRVRTSLAVICLWSLARIAFGDIPYLQGFETNVNDWTAYLSIERVPSAGGTLGLKSPHGDYHAEILNSNDLYSAGGHLGQAGYTYFGNPVSTYGGDFFKALTVYIDAAHWESAGGGGFWIDTSPRATNDVSAYYPGTNDEQSFNFSVPTQGMVRVRIHGSTPLVTLSNRSWYTFVETFRYTGPATNDFVENDFYVYNKAGHQIASNSVVSELPSFLLGGNSYLWITVWKNGFADDILAIDDARTGYLPFIPYVKPVYNRTLIILR